MATPASTATTTNRVATVVTTPLRAGPFGWGAGPGAGHPPYGGVAPPDPPGHPPANGPPAPGGATQAWPGGGGQVPAGGVGAPG